MVEMSKHTLARSAPKPGMTLGDLRSFIASTDGAPNEAKITTQIYFGRGVRTLTIEWEDGA